MHFILSAHLSVCPFPKRATRTTGIPFRAPGSVHSVSLLKRTKLSSSAIVPIVCVLTLTASLVNELALDFSSDPIPLLKYITYVLSNSAGVLGLITFVFDPGFLYAFGRYRYFEFELKSKGDPFQTITPPNPTDLISVTSIDPIAFDQYRKCKNLL
ncbi:hypothetical protein DSO57_1008568 [Entomophthora muscae]|uniref:Uncharacterized protein n=1 Tax=Entomophthora muscae TaxID=34485 RepID=A0ACC2RLX2_9FUNG|nr:hypothetical protein DSO57_1008568 [Entomophthora muscae]